MKKLVLLVLAGALAFPAFGQWSNTGNNTTTGNLTIGGNIGIGTTNPTERLQIGTFGNTQLNKISIPGTNNFDEVKLGHYGTGNSALEFINAYRGTSTIFSTGLRFL